MGSFEPDRRATRPFRRPPAGPPPTDRRPPGEEPLRFDEYGRPARGPRFDRPPPPGNDWYGAPPVGDRPSSPPPPPPPLFPPAPDSGRRSRRPRRPRRLCPIKFLGETARDDESEEMFVV